MATQDYAALDEDDYYGQNFETKGVVSVWLGFKDDSDDPPDLDVLQDLCGVGYYDLDFQECNHVDFEVVPVRRLLEGISFSESFLDAALNAATRIGKKEARWVLVQYDFAYDPSRVKRPIATDPVFLGVFPFKSD